MARLPGEDKVKRINVGFVGAGYIAHYHARGLKECEDVTLAAVANPSEDKRLGFAEKYGITRTFEKAEALIDDDGVDAVILSTPNVFHYPHAIRALNAGKHVFVEKPMACSVAQAEDMGKLAAERGLRLMVGHMWRFDREALYLVSEIAGGAIGPVFRTTAYGIHANWGPGGWFAKKELAWGGALADMGIHAIDTTRFLIGDPAPVRVYASIGSRTGKTELDDTGVVMITWETGVTSVVETGWWQPHMDGPEAGTRLYGTGGYASLFPTLVKVHRDDSEVVIRRDFPDRAEHCDQHIYTGQMQEFIAAIREGREPVPGAAEGLVNMRIVEAAYRSSETGKAVEIGGA